MPTASRTAVCSLTTPEGYSSGIDQPPNSANFAPRATCRSCSGDCSSAVAARLVVHAREPTPASRPASRAAGGRLACGGDVVHPPQRQPRQDPSRRRGRRASPHRKGRRRWPTGGEDVAEAYGRKFRPLLPRSASPARPARPSRSPPPARSARRCWCWSAWARRAGRRAPYDGPPASRPARHQRRVGRAGAARRRPPSWCAAVTEGYLLGGYRSHATRSTPTRTPGRPATVPCSARSRAAEATAAFERGPGRRRRRRAPPATG